MDVVWVQGAVEEVSAGTGVPGQAAQVWLPKQWAAGWLQVHPQTAAVLSG